MKQTAVEWLFEQLDVVDSSISYEYFNQAKKLEKQQQQGYSEEEVIELLERFAPHIRYNYKELPLTWVEVVKEWFEQFKK